MKIIHKLLYFTFIIGLTLSFVKCAPSTPKSVSIPTNTGKINSNDIEEVSMINLIANPEKYDGYHIRIIGYLNMDLENEAIYLHEKDYNLKIDKNSIGVEILRRQRDSLLSKELNNKYVFVEGTFNVHRANEGSFNSSIVNITRLGLLSPNDVGSMSNKKQK